MFVLLFIKFLTKQLKNAHKAKIRDSKDKTVWSRGSPPLGGAPDKSLIYIVREKSKQKNMWGKKEHKLIQWGKRGNKLQKGKYAKRN